MTDQQVPQRPTRLTPEMAKRAATRIAENLVAESHIEARHVNDAIRDIARNGRTHMDGYLLARELDKHEGWDCNLDMAETLDGWSAAVDEEIKAAQKEWAETNDTQPPFPVGTRVIARWGGEEIPGTIEEIFAYDVARFCVKADDETGTSRMIVYFEDARAVEEAGA